MALLRISTLMACVLGCLMAQTGNAQSWSFTTCSFDVEDYFASYFPEYNFFRRRRLTNEGSTTPSDEELFYARAKASRGSFEGSSVDPSVSASTDGSGGDSDGSESSILDRLKNRKPKMASYLPPIGAWDNARMAASGCTSCEDGCCDAADITLDCGTMQVPVDYSTSIADITLTVYRVRISSPSLSPTENKHLWILQGGPGFSGLSILPLSIPSLQFANEIYVPDHRGTGNSAELLCPDYQSDDSDGGATVTPDEVPACVLDADFPDKMTTSNAARDLQIMINAARAISTPTEVFVHGYSYGTRWAQRFLQLYPNSVDKVVLEGIVAKDTVFNDFAIGAQYGGARYMEKCIADDLCNNYFDQVSLQSKIASITSEGNSNPCTVMFAGIGSVRQGVQFILNDGIESGIDGPFKTLPGHVGEELYMDWRSFSLALVSRWVRCKNSPANAKAFAAGISYLLSLHGGLLQLQSSETTSIGAEEISNQILYGMVAYSELRRYPMESSSAYATANANVDWGFVNDYTYESEESDAWGAVKYSTDAFAGLAPSNVESKLLLINGEIDGQTPRFQAYETFDDITLAGEGNKTLAIINDAGHHASGFGCGLHVVKTFLNSTADTTCAITAENSAARPLESGFTVPTFFSQTLMGVNDVWETQDGESNLFCTSPPASSNGFSPYCDRCFDNCLLQAKAGITSNCECGKELGLCYKSAGISDPINECQITTIIYGYNSPDYSQFRLGGVCYNSCAGSFQLLTLTEWIYVGVGVVVGGCLLFVIVIVIHQRRVRKQMGNGSVVNGPSTTFPTASVVVQQPTMAAVPQSTVSAAQMPIAPAGIPRGGGVVLSRGPINQ